MKNGVIASFTVQTADRRCVQVGDDVRDENATRRVRRSCRGNTDTPSWLPHTRPYRARFRNRVHHMVGRSTGGHSRWTLFPRFLWAGETGTTRRRGETKANFVVRRELVDSRGGDFSSDNSTL